jgi:hypothetical protein
MEEGHKVLKTRHLRHATEGDRARVGVVSIVEVHLDHDHVTPVLKQQPHTVHEDGNAVGDSNADVTC